MFDTSVFRNIKSPQDFAREEQEFMLRKRQQEIESQMGEIGLQKAQQDLTAPKLPFQGTSWDAQTANEAYKYNLSKGMSDEEARRNAVDMVLKTKVDHRPVTDPYTGQITYQATPRTPMFGGEPKGVPNQLFANQGQGSVNQQYQQGQMPPAMPPQIPLSNIPPISSQELTQGQMPQDILAMPPREAMGVMDNQKISVDPRAFESPDVQKDLAKSILQDNISKQKEKPEAEKSFNNLLSEAGNIFDRVDDAIEMINPFTAGLGSYTNVIAGTPGTNLRSALQTIQADAAFSRLQQMRDASKTGGALGQVSERELALLQNARVALDQDQSPANLKNNLQQYKEIRLNAMKNVADAYKKDYGQYPQGFESFINQRSLDKKRLRFNPATGRLE